MSSSAASASLSASSFCLTLAACLKQLQLVVVVAILITTPAGTAAWIAPSPLVPSAAAAAASGYSSRRSITTIQNAKKPKGGQRRSNAATAGGGGFGKRVSRESDAYSSTSNSTSTGASTSTSTSTTIPTMSTVVTNNIPVADTAVASVQHHQHHQHQPPPGLVQLSESPLLYTFANFMDPDACTNLTQETTEAFCLLFRQRVADLLDGQQSDLDGMKFNLATSRDRNNHPGAAVSFPDGVHMDTNNDCLFRHLTAILYLNDVPSDCGGATIFPVAGVPDLDPALLAARRLLQDRIGHTRSCGVVRTRGVVREADAQLLENRCNVVDSASASASDSAIRVQPESGKLLLFFSRTESGAEDARSWHGGERLRDGTGAGIDTDTGIMTEKRLLTIFKQVDYGGVEPALNASSLEKYLSHQIQTQAKCLRDYSLS